MAVREEFRFKAVLKKRWLFYVGAVFVYLLPLLMIIEKTVTIEPNKSNSKISINLAGFIIGLVYLIAFSKKAREVIKKLKTGFIQKLLSGFNFMMPILMVTCMVYLAINALQGFDATLWYIVISMAIGVLIQAVEVEINKSYLRRLRIYEIAKEKVDTAKEEERIRAEEAEEEA
jgi:MFS family permease